MFLHVFHVERRGRKSQWVDTQDSFSPALNFSGGQACMWHILKLSFQVLLLLL